MKFIASSFLILLISSLGIIQAQEKELTITYTLLEQILNIEHRVFEVTSTKNSSISIFKSEIKEGTTRKITLKNGDKIELPLEARKFPDKIIYKNYKEQYLISQEIIKGRNFYTKEPLNQMQWQLTGNTKTILNYNCQEATTSFRGRDYIAYFTTELPFKVAPFKFYGLPGVILQIYSKDKQFTIEAFQLNSKTVKKALINPFKNKKTISWDKFTDIYIKENIESNNKLKIHINETIISQKRKGNDTSDYEAMLKVNTAESRLEVIIPENDFKYQQKQLKKAKKKNENN